MAEYTYSNAGENRFWLQIIGDYARLLIHGIPPEDENELRQMRTHIQTLDGLLARARQDLTPEELKKLNEDANAATRDIRGFFLQLLNMQIRGGYPILVKSPIISNAIDFADEYLFLLDAFMKNGQPPARRLCDINIFWMFIFTEISKVISGDLGFFEKDLRERADEFTQDFTNLLMACMEMLGLSKIGTMDFPFVTQHNQRLMQKTKEFYAYLTELIELSRQNRLPGTVSMLYLDRTRRMICYYMRQLGALTGQDAPDCNPASPRMSNI